VLDTDKLEMVPFVNEMSLASKPTGFSLKAKLSTAVSPGITDVVSLLIDKVGAVVSAVPPVPVVYFISYLVGAGPLVPVTGSVLVAPDPLN
jgi:hypothetical protein